MSLLDNLGKGMANIFIGAGQMVNSIIDNTVTSLNTFVDSDQGKEVLIKLKEKLIAKGALDFAQLVEQFPALVKSLNELVDEYIRTSN